MEDNQPIIKGSSTAAGMITAFREKADEASVRVTRAEGDSSVGQLRGRDMSCMHVGGHSTKTDSDTGSGGALAARRVMHGTREEDDRQTASNVGSNGSRDLERLRKANSTASAEEERAGFSEGPRRAGEPVITDSSSG